MFAPTAQAHGGTFDTRPGRRTAGLLPASEPPVVLADRAGDVRSHDAAGIGGEAVTKDEAVERGEPEPWYSVEGSAEIATDAIDEATFTYASLYLLQYEDDPEKFRAALDMALSKTHGIMLFDLVYLEQYGWWDEVDAAFGEAEHGVPHRNPAFRDLLTRDR